MDTTKEQVEPTLEKTIEEIHQDALLELESASDAESIKAISIRYLGRKGAVTQFLRSISNLPEDIRPEAGKKANETKKNLDVLFKNALGSSNRVFQRGL